MTLLNKILEWTKELPKWESDAMRRLLQREGVLSKDDYGEIYALFKDEHKLPNPDGLIAEPLDDSHLPAIIQPGQSIILKEIGELSYVNRIAPDQKLRFSEKGMTVIYGGNGSGKSGYVRVMKQACRCRDQSEIVHPDVNNEALKDKTPTAKFEIIKDGNTHKIEWKQGCVPDELLSSISVFDSQCARLYLTEKQEVAYLPYGLDIVENLGSDVFPELKCRLLEEIEAVDINIDAVVHLNGATKVGELVAKLSASTNLDDVKTLGTLSEEEEQRITDIGKALAEADPMTKYEDLKHFATRLTTLATNVKKASLLVNDAVNRLKKLDDEMVDAGKAEKNAALALRSKELLPGTGEALWKDLFEAARQYSTNVAYPKYKFPHTDDNAVCPLCQTSLDELARQRLERFEQYIKNDVAKTANKKRENLAVASKEIVSVNLVITPDQELFDEISRSDGDIVQTIKEYQIKINEKQQWIRGALDNHEWDNSPYLSASPYMDLRKLAAQNLRAARTFKKAANKEHKEKLEREHSELRARQELQKSRQLVLDLIERMKKVADLEKCKNSLNTKHISDKSKELASEEVTKGLKSALDYEFYELGVDHIKTNLKEQNIKGKMLHQILLEIPTKKNIHEILSEGEQRAIALGAFLAELSLANHSCGIVFDDPVSSLDHYRRQDVARRLANEAKKRQVIVFTHDTSFLGQIHDEIRKNKLDKKICFLEWKDYQYAGKVCEGLPWMHSGYEKRIKVLENKHNHLKNKRSPYTREDDAAYTRNVYSLMRATIERVIQDVVFNGVIDRYRERIIVGELKGVVGFNDKECGEINRLYKLCSGLADAHDSSSAKNSSVPNATKLGEDINALKAVITRIENRKCANKKSTRNNSHNKRPQQSNSEQGRLNLKM